MKGWKVLSLVGQKIQKFPLRHERDELAASRQFRKVGKCYVLRTNLRFELRDFLMRFFEEFIEQSEFVHRFQRRGMNRISAKIAEEVGMFFDNEDIDTGSGEKETHHHAGRTAPGDADAGLNGFHFGASVVCHTKRSLSSSVFSGRGVIDNVMDRSGQLELCRSSFEVHPQERTRERFRPW